MGPPIPVTPTSRTAPGPRTTARGAPLLELTNVYKSFPLRRERHRAVRALDRVSVQVPERGALAIVGESGCGKSTLARLILRLMPIDAGTIRFEGTDIHSLRRPDLRRMRARMSMVFQDPLGSLNPALTIAETLREPLEIHRIGRNTDERRMHVARLLEQVGLDPAWSVRRPDAFSGGQRQRIAIARALATAPRLLICDEPTSALDVSVQARILDLLRQLQHDTGVALLFITHNLAIVPDLCDQVAVMYLGRIVEQGPTRTVFSRPRHPYTRALLDSVPLPRATPNALNVLPGEPPNPINPPNGCAFHPRCPLAEPRCRETTPALRTDRDECDTDPVGRRVACHLVEAP